MPFFPDLPAGENATINTLEFLGLNRGLSIADGEMADMLNMSSDHYPVLSTRKPRVEPPFNFSDNIYVGMFGDVVGMLGTDRVIVCVRNPSTKTVNVYVDGVKHALELSADLHMQPKHLVSMGAYVCIWPDKKYFNITNPDDYGDMGVKWTPADGSSISAMMCRKDGTNYDMDSITVSGTAPAEPEDQQLWLDTSGEDDVLKQYSAIYQEWIQVATTYVKIQATGIGKGLKASDAVHISGARTANEAAAIAEDEGETLSFPAEGFYLDSTGYGNATERTKVITVSGLPDGAVVTQALLKFDSGIPLYGSDYKTVNGIPFEAGEHNEIPVEVTGNGDYSFLFRFMGLPAPVADGSQYGTITISNLTLDVTYTAVGGGEEESTETTDVSFLNTTNLLYGAGDDYIIVAGLLNKAVTLANTLTVELKIPDLDFVCEANNRIWGCSYANVDGTLTNEIRCCALGDFRNWYRFEGTSMDSYVMSVGSDGKFTGAYSLQGVPLIWKEGFLHKISGTQPSNFTLNTIRCRGVQDGSWRSMAVVNETLMYKAQHDVMAYDGSMPYSISEKLGSEQYYAAVGGSYRDKYYLSMRNASKEYATYVFDSAKGLWHKEDEQYIMGMATANGNLVLAVREGESLSRLYAISGSRDAGETFSWSATFGVFGYAYERSKYLSRFNIRAQMDAGSEMTFEIMYDSSGKWEKMGTMRSVTIRTFTLPVIPRRCDHCQIRISGKGDVKIYSIARVFEEGGN